MAVFSRPTSTVLVASDTGKLEHTLATDLDRQLG